MTATNEPITLGDDARLYSLGESALVLDAQGALLPGNNPAEDRTLGQQRRIWWLADRLASEGGVDEIVPGMNNLTITFDPLHARDKAWWRDALASLWHDAPAVDTLAQDSKPRCVELTADYSDAVATDIDKVAAHCGLSRGEVIEKHCSALYTVLFIGFQPGFAYLHGLPAELATPRKQTPSTRVPAGAIAIGGAQTAVYPFASPGGWHVIGRCDTSLFDPAQQPASLLRAGDQLRFCRIA